MKLKIAVEGLKTAHLRKITSAFKFSVLALPVFLLLANACGRYLPPIPPEQLSPRSVDQIVVTPSAEGVAFAWIAPDQDQQGKELRSMNGYRIQRKEILERGDETNESVPFKEVGYVSDKHIQVRDELRAEARAQGHFHWQQAAGMHSLVSAMHDAKPP